VLARSWHLKRAFSAVFSPGGRERFGDDLSALRSLRKATPDSGPCIRGLLTYEGGMPSLATCRPRLHAEGYATHGARVDEPGDRAASARPARPGRRTGRASRTPCMSRYEPSPSSAPLADEGHAQLALSETRHGGGRIGHRRHQIADDALSISSIVCTSRDPAQHRVPEGCRWHVDPLHLLMVLDSHSDVDAEPGTENRRGQPSREP
jgi:hypothetical protein